MKRLPFVLLLCGGLAACASSPPTKFYTLDPVAPDRAGHSLAGPPLQVGRVQLPGILDRSWFVRRLGPNRVDVSTQDRWAGPLDEMIQRTLSTDLATRLPAGLVLAPSVAGPENVRHLQLTINRFIGDETDNVVLDVDWSIARSGTPENTTALAPSEHLTCPAASGKTGALVAAMSVCLSRLSDRIVVAAGRT